jgi:toxin HigB-1
MIRSFGDKTTELLFNRQQPIKHVSQSVQKAALRKLLMLDAAESLEDLRSPPANRLEKLRGDRQRQYSVRVNDQWRICFRFKKSDAWDVELTDYH